MHLPPHERTMHDVIIPLHEQRRPLALNCDLLVDGLGELVVGKEGPIPFPGCEFGDEVTVEAFGRLPGEGDQVEGAVSGACCGGIVTAGGPFLCC